MPNVKAQSSNKYQITKFKVEISFDIWILAFEIDSSELTISPAHYPQGQWTTQ